MIQEETISAVATAVGEGGIGIIRMSGREAVAIADRLFRGKSGRRASESPSHMALYGDIVDPESGRVVDEVLLLSMRCPRSYTVEDVVEIHCHGGPVPLRRILQLTLESGARLAEPGEFTRRAFLNGRLDLVQAEAVIDVIRAKTDASLQLALGHLSGDFSRSIRSFRTELVDMIAQLEAAIDFPEEDIEELAAAAVNERVEQLAAEVDRLLATVQTGRILRDGMQTVIIGRPNVGKSSLLNALARANKAIVTDIPGTTRDIIEEYVNLSGVPLKIIDTAGIRETADLVESIGVQKALDVVKEADLVLLLLDASSHLTAEDRKVFQLLSGQPAIVLVNKSDLPARLDMDELTSLLPAEAAVLRISVQEGTGLEELERHIVGMVYGGEASARGSGMVANVRHAHLLRQTHQHLDEASRTIGAAMPPDCVVVDLRAAWDTLGEITGDTVADDLLHQIFSRFCIGK